MEAFASAPEVVARLTELEQDGWVGESDYVVETAGSCGVVGCYITYLAGRLMTSAPGDANPQSDSVQANVVILQPHGQVVSVELISAN